MTIKGYSAFPKAPALLEPHHQTLWGGGPTPLQRCSQCILQPQPTGQLIYLTNRWDTKKYYQSGSDGPVSNGNVAGTSHSSNLNNRSLTNKCSLKSYPKLTFSPWRGFTPLKEISTYSKPPQQGRFNSRTADENIKTKIFFHESTPFKLARYSLNTYRLLFVKQFLL